jgi:hypothetical protein
MSTLDTMNEIPVTLTALTISREKVLEHLHRLADGFMKCGQARLSNEMLTLIDQIERGEFNNTIG